MVPNTYITNVHWCEALGLEIHAEMKLIVTIFFFQMAYLISLTFIKPFKNIFMCIRSVKTQILRCRGVCSPWTPCGLIHVQWNTRFNDRGLLVCHHVGNHYPRLSPHKIIFPVNKWAWPLMLSHFLNVILLLKVNSRMMAWDVLSLYGIMVPWECCEGWPWVLFWISWVW